METRTILQIVLGTIVALILGLGGFIIYELTREAEKVVVKEVIQPEVVERVNPWADKGPAAIALVKRMTVVPPLDPEAAKKAEEEKKNRRGKKKRQEEPEQEPTVTYEEALRNPEFQKNQLQISGEPVGWESVWWDETKYGPHFFLVRFAYKDGDITLGPQWVVDLKSQKVVAKNLPAMIVENPSKGMESEYYGKKQQVVGAISAHTFPSGINLAGALLLYFEQRSDSDQADNVVGWTIDHDRGNIFRAYFQWLENKEPVYAEFEFDYDRKALKPINLQAANLMSVGEDFQRQRVSIMPMSYNPTAPAAQRWTGAARKSCKQPKNAPGCSALAAVFDEKEIVESLEWLLTARANTAEEFEQCKQDRKCRWMPSPKSDGEFNVKYIYELKGKEQSVSWDIDLKTKEVKPADRVSGVAFSVIRAR
ncbi:MAG: hypothetical protein R3E66_21680 [bacterium]